MKLAVIAPPDLPIPALSGYGGIQRGIYELVMGLAERGHSVHLIAPGSSAVTHPNIILHGIGKAGSFEHRLANAEYAHNGKLTLAAYESDLSTEKRQEEEYRLYTLGTLLSLIADNEIDLINMRWDDPMTLSLVSQLSRPVVAALHNPTRGALRQKLVRPGCIYTAHTQAHRQDFGANNKNIVVVPYGIQTHGVEFSLSTLTTTTDEPTLPVLRNIKQSGRDYLVSVSSITRAKGQKTAIAMAKAVGLPLIIVGTPIPRLEQDFNDSAGYFEQEVLPHVDNKNVFYFGNAREADKYELMRYAKALVFPSGFEDRSWIETFGRVVAESLTVGTPVVAYRGGGGAAEQITHGKTGYLFDSFDEAVAYTKQIDGISRQACRDHAEQDLDTKRFVDASEDLFQEIISNNPLTR